MEGIRSRVQKKANGEQRAKNIKPNKVI